jgi:trimeric autotransporter adhesin
MNHIYRRIWSAAKRCWVVGSELTKRGPAARRSVSVAASAAVLALSANAMAVEGAEKEDPGEETETIWNEQEDSRRSGMSMNPFMTGGLNAGLSLTSIAPQSTHYQLAIVNDVAYRDSTATGDDTVVVGSRSAISGRRSVGYGNGIRSTGEHNVAIGTNVKIEHWYATAVGDGAYAGGGWGATAYGNDSRADGGNAIAIGSGSRASTGGGIGGIALGGDARAGTSGYSGAIAVGNKSNASYDAMAIGYESRASVSGSVALGTRSVANETDTVSVGSSTLKRRVMNVKDARLTGSSSDAVTGSQLYWAKQDISRAQTAADTAKTNASTAQSTANTAKSTAENAMSAANAAGYLTASGSTVTSTQRAQASGTGALASGLNALASGSGASAHGYNAKANAIGSIAIGSGAKIEASSSNYGIAIGASASTGPTAYQVAIGYQASAAGGASSMALGASTKANHSRSVALGVLSVTTANDQVSIGSDSVKRTISGMKDGLLSATSTEGVTGKQLFETNAQVGEVDRTAKAAQTAADTAMDDAGTALTAATTLGGLVGQVSTTGNVRLGEKNSGTVLDMRNSAGANRKVSGVADAVLSTSSAEAVSGKQLYSTNSRVSDLEGVAQYVSIGSAPFSERAEAGVAGVAVGNSAKTELEGGTAVGTFAEAMGKNSTAIGRAATVSVDSENGFAMGVGAQVGGGAGGANEGVAIGAGARVGSGAHGSLALGNGSQAVEEGVASFGGVGVQRRLVNIARGTADHNAITVSQLKDSLDPLGGGAGMDANGNIIAPTYSVQSGTQNTVEDALMALDGAVITAGRRADKVEGQLGSIFQDSPSIRADGMNQITLNGVNGMVLTNLADGRVAPGSRDAVTGSQLYAAEQKISQNRKDLETMRKEREVGAQTMRGLDASGPIDFGGVRLTGVAEGKLSADSSDVVRGSQLYETNSRVSELEGVAQFVSAQKQVLHALRWGIQQRRDWMEEPR